MSGDPFLIKTAVSLDMSTVGELVSLAGCVEGIDDVLMVLPSLDGCGRGDSFLVKAAVSLESVGELLPSLASCARGAEGVEGVLTVGELLPSLTSCGRGTECDNLRAGELLPLLADRDEVFIEVSIEVALTPEL